MALNLKRKKISQKYHKNQHKQTNILVQVCDKAQFLINNFKAMVSNHKATISIIFEQWLKIIHVQRLTNAYTAYRAIFAAWNFGSLYT